MKFTKSNISNVEFGRANSDSLVERSTNSHLKLIEQPTNLTLYKLANQYAELKRIAGWDNVSVRDEYEILCKEAKQD